MTVDEFKKVIKDDKDFGNKYSVALKEAMKEAKSEEDYPEIIAKVAAEFGYELSVEEIQEKMKNNNDIQELSDDELENVAGGFMVYSPWWY